MTVLYMSRDPWAGAVNRLSVEHVSVVEFAEAQGVLERIQ